MGKSTDRHLLPFIYPSLTCKTHFRFECPGLGNFPNPDDCSSFYVCGSGEHALLRCPGDLLFDAALQICNNPQSVVCTTETTTSPVTTSSSTAKPSTSTELPSPTTAVPTTSTQGPEPKCPTAGSEFIENPADCATFYVCIEGHYDLAECPEGYGFDAITKDCVPGQEVGCLVTSSTTASPNAPVACPPLGQELFPNPSDCGSFYICHDGTFDLITCPVGYEFDQNSFHCELAGTTGCGGSTTVKPPSLSCSDKPNGAIFPNPNNCTKFYQCSNGAVVINSCPPGLEFNAQQSVCDQPERANCHASIYFK